jgi:hypothetical protein
MFEASNECAATLSCRLDHIYDALNLKLSVRSCDKGHEKRKVVILNIVNDIIWLLVVVYFGPEFFVNFPVINIGAVINSTYCQCVTFVNIFIHNP